MQAVITFLSDLTRQVSLVDVVLIFILCLYAIEGYAVGLTTSLLDALSFFLALVGALQWYKGAGNILVSLTHMPKELALPLAFLIVALLLETILRIFRMLFVRKFLSFSWHISASVFFVDRLLGIVFGFVTGSILLSFLLTFLSVLPIATPLKSAIDDSHIAQSFIAASQSMQGILEEGIGHTPTDLLTFFTIEPNEGSSVPLGFRIDNGPVDTVAEEKMFTMVNTERQRAGLPALTYNVDLQTVARAHGQDMLARGYFAHNTPEGLTPFDRMHDTGITFQYAGENLAFSQTTDLAMTGLMHSPGHRANILSPNFKQIGIGVIDAGVYGKMFVQEFTD